jgi:uncharacterized Zn finger protein
MPNKTEHKFPCPLCTHPLEVRLTKKNKPYVICDPCGVQLFVRGPDGINTFKRLIERGNSTGLWDRLEQMERHYRLSCRDCGCRFWVARNLLKTSTFDGSLKGFRCPKCGEIVPWEGKP